jgi:hypothetical protein
MLRSLAFGKLATMVALLALPVVTTGCGTTRGWGWSPPSMASLNPWKSSATNSSLASNNSKPSSVPTPPAQMLAGNGLARGGVNAENGSPSYSANTYSGGRPANGNGSAGDYNTRQVSATQGEGYRTGPYNTGGSSTAQQGPYGGTSNSGASSYGGAPTYGAAPNYGGATAATADRRSDPAYGSGNTNPAYGSGNTSPGYNANSQPGYNPQGGQNAAPSSNPQYPNTGASNYHGAGPNSTYAGSTGLSTGPSRASVAPVTNYGADAYRPGSTARGNSEVQRASYDNQGGSSTKAAGGSDYSYPTTPAGDDSAYQ